MSKTKHLIALIAFVVSGSALAQYTARLPSTCTPDGARCTQATPVVNPDGTSIAAGGGSVPTGAAGAPNTNVLTVQGIPGGSPQNVQTQDTYTAPTSYSAAANTIVPITVGGGQGTAAITIAGLTASGATLTASVSDNKGASYNPIRYMGTATVPGATTIAADGIYSFALAGHTNLQLTVTTGGSGSFTAASNLSTQVREVNLGGAGTALTNPLFATITSAQEATIASNQTNGSQIAQVRGDVAAGAANTGNPIQAGGVVGLGTNFGTGNRAPLAMTEWGGAFVSVAGPVAALGDNLTPYVMQVQARNTKDATAALLAQSNLFNPATNQSMLARGDANGAWTVLKGSATFTTGQVSVGTSATLVRAADTGRTSITVNVGAANSCAFGNSGVTLTTGYLLPAVAGSTDTTATSAALYGVCSATTTVSYKVILP